MSLLDANVSTAEAALCRALMRALPGGVVVCDGDGIVRTSDETAHRLVGATDGPREDVIPAGTSLFEVMDDAVLTTLLADPLTTGDASAGASESVLTRLGDTWVSVTAHPVGEETGLIVLQVEPHSASDASGVGSHGLLRDLIESMRAPLASVRAAIETMTQYPSMDPAAAEQFHRIIEEQTVKLSETLEAAVAAYAQVYRSVRPLEVVEAADLIRWLADHLATYLADRQAAKSSNDSNAGAACAMAVRTGSPSASGPLRIRVDRAALQRAVEFLAVRVANAVRPTALRLGAQGVRDTVALDLEWEGPPVTTDRLQTWAGETLSWGNTIVEMTLSDILDHHDAQIWAQSADTTARLRLLFPAS